MPPRFLTSILTGREEKERFRREIETMKTCAHPNLIRLYDADPSPTPAWLAASTIPRGTLDEDANRERYRGNPLSILTDARPLADALASAARARSDPSRHQAEEYLRRRRWSACAGRLWGGDSIGRCRSAHGNRAGAQSRLGSRLGAIRRRAALHRSRRRVCVGEGDLLPADRAKRDGITIGVELEKLVEGLRNVPGMLDTLALLEKCIVTLETNVTIHDGEMLRDEIDAILTNASGPKRSTWSFRSWPSEVRPTVD